MIPFGMTGLVASAAIGSAAEAARSRPAPRSSAETARIDALEKRLDSLGIACQAMWELLRDNTSLTEYDLEAKIEEIDLRDGVADGRITRQRTACPSCGRTNSSRHKACIYCGDTLANDTRFGV